MGKNLKTQEYRVGGLNKILKKLGLMQVRM